jgi:hypothetical protein
MAVLQGPLHHITAAFCETESTRELLLDATVFGYSKIGHLSNRQGHDTGDQAALLILVDSCADFVPLSSKPRPLIPSEWLEILLTITPNMR